MMRRPSSFLRYVGAVGLLCCLAACAPSEFVMKQPPTSPTASNFPKDSSVYLLQNTRVRISNDGYSFCETTHKQIKVLNQAGTKRGFSALVSYRKPHEKITKFAARVIRPGGTWISQKVDGSRPLSSRGRGSYLAGSSFNVYKFRFNVVGSVLEYRYTKSGNSWMMAPHFLQGKLPIVKSVYSVSVPQGIKVRSKVFSGIQFAGSKVKYTKGTDPNDSSRVLHTWVANNIPAIHGMSEAGAPSWYANAARVQTVLERRRLKQHKGSANSWSDVAGFYTRLVGKSDVASTAVTQKAKEVAKGASNQQEKIKKIYEFVSQKIRSIPVGIGLGGWQPQAAAFTLKQRYGDCKAKATLLKAMLGAVGVKSHQVLVRTRKLGSIPANFPSDFGAFNHVVNYVPSTNQYLDSTSASTPYGYLPASDLGASALIVNGNKSKFTTIGHVSPEGNVLHHHLELTRKKKQIDVVWTTRRSGNHRLGLSKMLEKGALKTDGAKKKWAKRQLRGLAMRMAPWARLGVQLKGTKITGVSVSDNSKVAVSKIAFFLPTRKTKNRLVYLPMYWAQSNRANTKFLAERKNFSVYNGLKVSKHIDEVVFKKWNVLEHPPTTSVKNKYFDYSLSCQKKEQYLSYRRDLTFNKPDIAFADHDGFRKAYDKVRESDSRIVVLQKGYGDKDKDGIPDNVDKCPKTKGPKKYDGCPDRDGDGIVDVKDACPDVKGVANSDAKKNGCPEVVLVKVTATEIKILQKIRFRTGSSRILRRSFGILDQVVQVLESRKNVRIRIEGHTDNRGNKKYNLRLSKRRAASVLSYLTKKGIDKARLESEGYGMAKPMVPNTNRKNRAKNRRVQFKVLKGKGVTAK